MSIETVTLKLPMKFPLEKVPSSIMSGAYPALRLLKSISCDNGIEVEVPVDYMELQGMAFTKLAPQSHLALFDFNLYVRGLGTDPGRPIEPIRVCMNYDIFMERAVLGAL